MRPYYLKYFNFNQGTSGSNAGGFFFCTVINTIMGGRLQIPGGCRFPGDHYHGGQIGRALPGVPGAHETAAFGVYFVCKIRDNNLTLNYLEIKNETNRI